MGVKNKKKKNKTSFTKGNMAARKIPGRPKNQSNPIKSEMQALDLTPSMLKRYLILNMHLPAPALRAKAKDETLAWIHRRIAHLLVSDLKTPGLGNLPFVLDRTIGPLMQKVEVTKTDPYENMTDAELEAEQMRLNKINETHMRYVEQEQERLRICAAKEVVEIERVETTKPDVSEINSSDQPTPQERLPKLA